MAADVGESVKEKAKKATSKATIADFGILDVIGAACAVLAVVAIIGSVYGVVPGKLAITLGGIAVGAWTLHIILAAYLWIFALLSMIGLVLGGMAFAYGHVNWIEKRLNVDIDRDGDVGESNAPRQN